MSPTEYGEQLAAREPLLTDEQVEQAARVLAPLIVAAGTTPGPAVT